MNNSFEEKYLDFKDRLFLKLRSSFVERTNDVVSMYDVFDAVSKKFGLYNAILIDNLDKEIKLMNVNNGFFLLLDSFNKKNRRIGDIKFHVQKDGYYYCEVIYVDENGKEIGRTNVDNTVKVGNADKEVLRNSKYFEKYLGYLGVFAEYNHDMEYIWDRKHPYVEPQVIGDDFLNAKLDLNKTNYTHAFLANKNDFKFALYKHCEYGLLEDHVDFYNDELMKKTPVEINKLDSFVQDIVRKQYDLENGKIKELVK